MTPPVAVLYRPNAAMGDQGDISEMDKQATRGKHTGIDHCQGSKCIKYASGVAENVCVGTVSDSLVDSEKS